MKPARLRTRIICGFIKDVRENVSNTVFQACVLQENLLKSMITVNNVNVVKKSN
jgi:hypothetical protein